MIVVQIVFCYDDVLYLYVFICGEVGWVLYLEFFVEDELIECYYDGFVDVVCVKNDYFWLLVCDFEVFKVWMFVDKDIFYNVVEGLLCVDWELVVIVVLWCNGCVFCVLVYFCFVVYYSKWVDDVDLLFDEGVDVDFGECWNVIVVVLVVFIDILNVFGECEIVGLCVVGFDDLEIVDVIYGVVFFNWVNRLMLLIGWLVVLV